MNSPCKIFLAIAFTLTTLTATGAFAEETKEPHDPNKPVSYYRDIRPIFQNDCYGCHQPAKQGGGFVMTAHASLLKGGESEDAAIVPSQVEESPLVDLITPDDGEAEMPKDASPLSADSIALIKRWIAEGAKDDTPASDAVVYNNDNPPKYERLPVLTSIEFSPDGKLLAVSGYHEVLLHDASAVTAAGEGNPEPIARLIGLAERVESNIFSPDGKRLVVAGGSPGRFGELQVWDVEARELIRSQNITFDTIYGASWSPDGKIIAFGCGDNTLRAVDAESGEQVFYQGTHNGWVLDTKFSVKGTHLVSVSRDRTLKLNEVATQRFVDNVTSITPGALKGGLYSVDRNPNKDELLIGGADGVPKIYRMFREKARRIGDDFNLVRKFPQMPGRLFSVRYNHDGSQIVVGSSVDRSGEVWVFGESDGKTLAKMEGIEGGIFTASFSPDGKFVVSGGFAGMVFVHEAATGKLVRKFQPIELSSGKDLAAK